MQSPDVFTEFLKLLAIKDSKINDQIFNNLFMLFSNNSDLLANVIKQQSPEGMDVLFSVALSKHGDFLKTNISSLASKEGFISTIIAKNPKSLANLFKCIGSKPFQDQLDGVREGITNTIKTKDGLDSFLKALAGKQTEDSTTWHVITKHSKPCRKIIIECVLERFKTLSNEDLLKIGEDIRAAHLPEAKSPYRDICLERHRHSVFGLGLGRDRYGETSLWQNLLKGIQECVKERKIEMKFEGTELKVAELLASEPIARPSKTIFR